MPDLKIYLAELKVNSPIRRVMFHRKEKDVAEKTSRISESPALKLIKVRQRIGKAQFFCPQDKAQNLSSNLMPNEVYKAETLKMFDEAVDQIVKGK